MSIFKWLKAVFTSAESEPKAQAQANSRRERGFHGQQFSGGLPLNPDIYVNPQLMRREIRALEQKSPVLRAILNREIDTVIGGGLTVAPEPQADALGISLAAAEKWSSDIAVRFDLWAQDKHSTLSGVENFYQAQAQAYRSYIRDGEFFVAFYYDKNKALTNPLRVTVLEVDQIRGEAIIPTNGGGGFSFITDDGIVRDDKGEETAYKIWKRDRAGGKVEMVELPARRGERVFCVHGYSKDYAGQGRGISQLGASLQWLSDISTLTEAETQKAINHASVSLFVKPSGNNPASNPLQSAGEVWKKIYGEAGAEEVLEVKTLADTFTEVPEAVFDKPAVGVFNLQPGEDLVPFQSTAPTSGFGQFVGELVNYISASIGMSAETILMKFGQNYSASRAALVLMWRKAVNERYKFASGFIFPVYEMWLAGEIGSGRVRAPGWRDSVLRQAWIRAHVNGDPMPNIDPIKAAQAVKTATELGLTTLDDEAMQYNGSSARANRAKLRQEFSDLPSPPWVHEKPSQDKERNNEPDTFD
jgi:lambda family phage portal protein